MHSGCVTIRKQTQGLSLNNWSHENVTKDHMFLSYPPRSLLLTWTHCLKYETIIFDGETKVLTGKEQKQGGESALNSNLVGQRFSGVVTGGTLGSRALLIRWGTKIKLGCFREEVLMACKLSKTEDWKFGK